VFEAGGFGVAVTVSLPEPVPLGRRRARLAEVLDPAGFPDAGLVGELASIADVRSQLAAYEAGVVAELARRRPVHTDLTEDEPGHGVAGWTPDRVPVGVSEFFADELALVMRTSQAAAVALAERSLALVRELPATLGALADGLIDLGRANAIVAALRGQSTAAGGPVSPGVVGEVEAQSLGWAVAGETPGRLRERAAAALIAVDEAAADRRRKKAERLSDVTVRALPDGLAQLVGELPAPQAVACREAVDRYARMLKEDGDARPIGLLRAQVLTDLILRPWDTSREPVTAHLTVLAPLPTLIPTGPAADPADPPTEADAATVDGVPITAGQLRELLAQLDGVCPGGLQAPTGGSLDISLVDPATGALRATVTRAELERLVRRGCPRHGGEAACGCPVLDRPPPVGRYAPSPAQRRYVRARDRTCRHPGCRRPAARTDLDHVEPHATGGITDCTNLCCLCRRHHRLKTHAPGWRFAMTPDGTLTVTTPSGVTRTTRPPGTRLPDELVLTSVGSSSVDDPPPF
jgi:hypothetical protein